MNQKESLMATRTSIKNKNKAKLGAAASLAAGGAVMGLDAGASSDPLGAYDNALLESAFRLLEEGQNQFLAAEDAPTQDSKRFKPEVNTAGAQAEAEPMVELHVAADATAPDVVVAQASLPELIVAQSSPAPAATPAPAADTAAKTGANTGASTAAGAAEAATAAEAGAAGFVGFTPMAAAMGIGALAVVADAASSTGGSDLNNDQDGNVLNDSTRLFSISGESVNSNEASPKATDAGLIGGTNFIDDSTHSFFS